MKKTLSKILVSLCMLGVFLLPLTPHLQLENKKYIAVIPNIASAQNGPGIGDILDPLNITDYIPSIAIPKAIIKTASDANKAVNGDDDVVFGCGVHPKHWAACFARFMYFTFFQFISGLTAVMAQLLDFFIYYSTSDEAYRNSFIEKGWGTVRDVANIFFIIGLMFIAIKTALNLSTTNSKKMLGNIIIFALVINFSLFATQVVVDASNIIAKIFYHQITPVDGNGVPLEEGVEQRSVTIGLVQKFDPVFMLTGTKHVTGTPGELTDKDLPNVSDQIGKFIFLMFMCIILMIFMIYVFLSTAFLFVGRTVSLWFSMILSPIAFASHAISTKIKGLGWDEWLPTLLKSAFMAPLFIFFLYLVILFGDLFALGSAQVSGGDTKFITSTLNTIIPFMLVFVLLSKAKGLAKEYSGELGNAINKGGAALVAAAIGGAALTTAFVGRNTVGAVSKYVQNDNARGKAVSGQNFKDQWNKGGLSRFNVFAYGKEIGKSISAGTAELIHRIPTGNVDAATGKQIMLGQQWQKADEAYGKQQHAVHALDEKSGEMAGKFGLKKEGLKYTDLTETQQTEVKKAIDKDTISKKTYNKKFENLDAEQAKSVDEAMSHPDFGIDTKGNLTYTIKAIFKDPGSINGYKNEVISTNSQLVQNTTGAKLIKDVEGGHQQEEHSKHNEGFGEFVRATRRGSYDARDISKTSIKSKGFLSKLSFGIVAAVALGMRTGIKSSLGSSYGTSNRSFGKDLGALLKEAVKDMKIEVKTDSHGGGNAKASGGGGHGGGGHH